MARNHVVQGATSALIQALAGAVVLAAVCAPLAAAADTFAMAGVVGEQASAELDVQPLAGASGTRRLLQDCKTQCKGQPKFEVCGADKKTYDNLCLTTCGKATVAYYGKCSSKPCLCPPVWAPVCAGGKSYINSCFAKCAGASGGKDGFCGSCSCPSSKATVCGIDGKNYDNVCKAWCAGTTPYYSGTCDKRIGNCACDSTYDPVCVSDVITTVVPGFGSIKTPYNATYANPCLAKCQGGATKWTKGTCGADIPYDYTAFQCGCSLEAKPVCAVLPITNTTVTSFNKCAAQCSGLKVLYDGVCKDECLCPYSIKNPDQSVCAAGEKPYKSPCQARCKGATTWTNGACKKCKSCPTPMSLSDYACGADGVTYQSSCAAECAGTTVKAKGMCTVAGK